MLMLPPEGYDAVSRAPIVRRPLSVPESPTMFPLTTMAPMTAWTVVTRVGPYLGPTPFEPRYCLTWIYPLLELPVSFRVTTKLGPAEGS